MPCLRRPQRTYTPTCRTCPRMWGMPPLGQGSAQRARIPSGKRTSGQFRPRGPLGLCPHHARAGIACRGEHSIVFFWNISVVIVLQIVVHAHTYLARLAPPPNHTTTCGLNGEAGANTGLDPIGSNWMRAAPPPHSRVFDEQGGSARTSFS